MKSRLKLNLIIITIFLICISYINPLNKSKKFNSSTKNKSRGRKQLNLSQQSNMISKFYYFNISVRSNRKN